MKTKRALAGLLSSLILCGAGCAKAAAAGSDERVSSSEATFVAPKGWEKREYKGGVRFVQPGIAKDQYCYIAILPVLPLRGMTPELGERLFSVLLNTTLHDCFDQSRQVAKKLVESMQPRR
jgi:hypothetical protein